MLLHLGRKRDANRLHPFLEVCLRIVDRRDGAQDVTGAAGEPGPPAEIAVEGFDQIMLVSEHRLGETRQPVQPHVEVRPAIPAERRALAVEDSPYRFTHDFLRMVPIRSSLADDVHQGLPSFLADHGHGLLQRAR